MKIIPILIFILSLTSLTANSQILVSRYNPNQEDSVNRTFRQTDSYSASKWRIALDGAFSYRLGKAAPGVPSEYTNKLKRGFGFGTDIHGFVSPSLGIGGKFSAQFHSSSYQGLEENFSTMFLGPSVLCRLFDHYNKNVWITGLSIGYLHCNDKATYNNTPYRLSKGTLGIVWDLGYDIRIDNTTFLGIKLSLIAGSVQISDSYDNQRENLSSLSLGVGLRF